jgi:hypothetical protein
MCASELVAARNVSVMKWEKEKAESLARLAVTSIDFCENEIGPRLEKVALDPRGGIISISHHFAITEDSYGNKILCPRCADGYKYADGTISEEAVTSVYYSREIIEQYLKDHCLDVEWYDNSFYSYGWGRQPGMSLIVSIK